MSSDSDEGRARERREQVLSQLSDAIEESHRKVMSGRIQDPERERARQGWHQTLAQLANSYRLLSKDRDIDEMHERLDVLESESGSDYRLK